MEHLMKCFLFAVVTATLFFVLSPGVLLTLPPCNGGKVLLSLQDDNDNCATSYTAAAVHALVFGVLVFLLCLMGKDQQRGMTSSFLF